MLRRVYLAFSIFLLSGMALTPILATTADADKTDAKFVVQVDLQSFRATRLGSKILESVQAMVSQEMKGGDVEQKVEEALGFDPLEEIQSITIRGSSFESPEEGLEIMVQLDETTGNLEGLMLALPGYEEEEVDGHTVYSFGEGDMRGVATIRESKRGKKAVLAATSRPRLMGLLGDSNSWSSNDVKKGEFLQVKILELPEEVYDQEQAANVAKMLTSILVNVGQVGDEIQLSCTLTAQKEKQAEQIQQLAQGAKAFVSLFEEEIGNEKEAEVILSLLNAVEVDRNGHEVTIRAHLPEKMVVEFLREEADLDL
jgi:hypothetical protein